MLELKKTPEHTIDRVFLLALLALFAATAFLVVSIGAKQYHSIADGRYGQPGCSDEHRIDTKSII